MSEIKCKYAVELHPCQAGRRMPNEGCDITFPDEEDCKNCWKFIYCAYDMPNNPHGTFTLADFIPAGYCTGDSKKPAEECHKIQFPKKVRQEKEQEKLKKLYNKALSHVNRALLLAEHIREFYLEYEDPFINEDYVTFLREESDKAFMALSHFLVMLEMVENIPVPPEVKEKREKIKEIIGEIKAIMAKDYESEIEVEVDNEIYYNFDFADGFSFVKGETLQKILDRLDDIWVEVFNRGKVFEKTESVSGKESK